MRSSDDDDTSFTSFFSETASGSHVPRAVFVDSDPTTRDEIIKGQLGRLFHPDNVLGYKRDCKNNFFEGRMMATTFRIKENVMDRVRMLVDLCSNLEGFIIFHAFGGGTGSGIGTEVLTDLRDQFGKKVIFQSIIYPSKHYSNCVVEPYNTIFSLAGTKDTVDLSFVLDNEAAYSVCEKNLGISTPSFDHVNALLAQAVSAMTTSLRFETELNANLTEILTNLVPDRRLRYPILSLSPVRHRTAGKHEQFATTEIITDLFERRNMLADVGDHLKMNRYMAAVVLLRGTETSKPSKETGQTQTVPIEANGAIMALQQLMNPKGSHREPVRFVPWLQGGFKVGVVDRPPCVLPGSEMNRPERMGCMLGNTTAVREIFVRQYVKFLKLWFHKAYVWQYLEAAAELDTFDEAKEKVRRIIDNYEDVLRQCAEVEGARLAGKTNRPDAAGV